MEKKGEVEKKGIEETSLRKAGDVDSRKAGVVVRPREVLCRGLRGGFRMGVIHGGRSHGQ